MAYVLSVSSVRLPRTKSKRCLAPGSRAFWNRDSLPAFRTIGNPTAIEQLGGALSRIAETDTAFGHRSARYNFLIVSSWPKPDENEKHIRWTRSLWQAMQPFSTGGVYVNYLGEEADEGAKRIHAAYGAAKHERLVKLKNKYDPGNLFRLNQNIKPAHA